ncbi:MAG: ribokinase [Clostridiales bacterium]|nr:ribokinase [Clostridiales bacterium]
MKYDAVMIGHISLDHNIDHLDNEAEVIGGAVTFSSASAYALGHRTLVVTKLAPEDKKRLDALVIPKEDIRLLPASSSTVMRNKYFTADKERRKCRCESVGTPFSVDDIPDEDAKIFHFAGLIYGDFNNEMIKKAAEKYDVAVDVQTLLRHRNDDGSMYFEDWKDKKEMLPYIKYLKTDAAEAEIMTGTENRKEAAKMLFDMGAKEILITHNTEVLAYDGKEFYTCPIRARNLSGRTGRGDTTFAAYYCERLYGDIPQALLFATATVSNKMETPGAYRGTREDVINYIRELYPDCLNGITL